MKKNTGTKIMALFALFGITISIVGTGILIIYDMYSGSNVDNINQDITQEFTKEQLEEYMKAYSGSLSSTGEVNIGTGEVVPN